MDGLVMLIGGVAGGAMALVMRYIPGLNVKWDRLSGEVKQAIMGALLVVAAVAIGGLSCADISERLTFVTCGVEGWLDIAYALFGALMTNQNVHRITPVAKSVRVDRELRMG